jgi:hypothetical protein
MAAPWVLAHPLVSADALPLPPVAVAAIAVVAVLVTATRPARPAAAQVEPEPEPKPHRGAQAVMIALLVLAVFAGRAGANQVTRNIAPALIVGAGWPLLVGLSALFGQWWHRANPWDGLARLFAPLTRDQDAAGSATSVWAAAVTAAALAWYLYAFRTALLPRSVGAAVAVYTIVTVGGCLVLGRATWLSRVEVVSIFAGWVARLRRGGLLVWEVPAGAATVLGILAGGSLFGLVRYTRLLNPLVFGLPAEVPAETVGVALAALMAVALLVVVRRADGGSGTVVAAVVPVAAGLALAASLVRGQALIAVQLLPILASDPLGRGWDLLGTAGWTPNPNPLGDTWHVVVQVLLIAAGGVAGAQVARLRSPNRNGGLWPATVTVAVLVTAGVLAITVV